MHTTILLTAGLLLVAATARADWDLVIRCTGAPPTCASPTVVGAPGVPPVPPPVVVPPPVLPPVDNTPFVWPPQPPNIFIESERYTALGECCYVSSNQFQNPAPGTHLFAGYPAGRFAGSGWRLWAPVGMDPATLRRLLATGAP